MEKNAKSISTVFFSGAFKMFLDVESSMLFLWELSCVKRQEARHN